MMKTTAAFEPEPILSSAAQEKSRRASFLVKQGQTRQMEKGVVFGTSLLGYDVKDGSMTVNSEGAELVRLIFHKYGMEKKSTSVIAQELQSAGYRTDTGIPKWYSSHIVNILKNEKYVGDLVQKKTFTPDYLTHEKKRNRGEEALVMIRNHHEPIVSRELWDLVQAEMEKRDLHGASVSGRSNRFLFSGKIQCGVCGASFVSRQRKRKDGSSYRRWGCFNATTHGTRHLDQQGRSVGCDIGMMLRDDYAMDLLKQCLTSLQFDREQIMRNVVQIAAEAVVSDDYPGIADEAHEIALIENGIREQAVAVMNCEVDHAVFYKNLLERMVVYPNGSVSVQLYHLPHKWTGKIAEETPLEIENDQEITWETDGQFLASFQVAILLALKEDGVLTDMQYRYAEQNIQAMLAKPNSEDL